MLHSVVFRKFELAWLAESLLSCSVLLLREFVYGNALVPQ